MDKINIYSFMNNGQDPSADEDHATWSKAPDQLLYGPWVEIILTNAVSS